MKIGTYIGEIAAQMGIPDASLEDLEEHALQQMRRAGYRIFLDRMRDGRFRVRVQRAAPIGDRHTGQVDVYNEHTTSTSSYPILRAWEKWRGHHEDSRHAD